MWPIPSMQLLKVRRPLATHGQRPCRVRLKILTPPHREMYGDIMGPSHLDTLESQVKTFWLVQCQPSVKCGRLGARLILKAADYGRVSLLRRTQEVLVRHAFCYSAHPCSMLSLTRLPQEEHSGPQVESNR